MTSASAIALDIPVTAGTATVEATLVEAPRITTATILGSSIPYTNEERRAVRERYAKQLHDEASLRYLVARADDYAKVMSFVRYCEGLGRVPITAMLGSTEKRLETFRRALWRPFQQSFFRRYGAQAVGTIERNLNCDGGGIGVLHGHLLVLFPDGLSEREIGGAVKDWNSSWDRLHVRATGRNLQHSTYFEHPKDNRGAAFARYITKAYDHCDRDLEPQPAKFGDKNADENQNNPSFLLKANLRGKELWQRAELPVRRRSARLLAEDFLIECERARRVPPVAA